MIKFLVNNLIDEAIVSASTVNALYPLSNIKDDRRTKCYRSTTSTCSIVFDMGTPESVDSVFIVDNWKNGFGFLTATLEGNGTDEWTSAAFSTTLDIDAKFGTATKFFTSVSYRFWRLTLTSSLSYCELSHVFIGAASTVETNGVNYNWTYLNQSLDLFSVNRVGQVFTDIIGNRKALDNLNFTIMNKDEIDVIHDVDDICSTAKGFYISLPLDDNNLVTNDNRYGGFYRLKESPSFENTTAGYFSVTLNLDEVK